MLWISTAILGLCGGYVACTSLPFGCCYSVLFASHVVVSDIEVVVRKCRLWLGLKGAEKSLLCLVKSLRSASMLPKPAADGLRVLVTCSSRIWCSSVRFISSVQAPGSIPGEVLNSARLILGSFGPASGVRMAAKSEILGIARRYGMREPRCKSHSSVLPYNGWLACRRLLPFPINKLK